jgi:hypothetical protein
VEEALIEMYLAGISVRRVEDIVADRLLNVACAMLKAGAPFNPSLATSKTAC